LLLLLLLVLLLLLLFLLLLLLVPGSPVDELGECWVQLLHSVFSSILHDPRSLLRNTFRGSGKACRASKLSSFSITRNRAALQLTSAWLAPACWRGLQ
jgi:hypothetical protein